jgi:hypothetical protein
MGLKLRKEVDECNIYLFLLSEVCNVLFRVVALYAALYAWCVVMLVASVYFFFWCSCRLSCVRLVEGAFA